MLIRRTHCAAKPAGRKTWATIGALILALLGILGLTTRAQTPKRTTRMFIDGKEVKGDSVAEQKTQTGGLRTTSAKWKDDHGSGTIDARNVELTPDSRDVNSIGRGGYLVIDEKRDGVRRHLKVEPASDGKLKRTYSVNGVTREIDEEGQAWLARILHDYFDPSRR